jgi:hypothetical protein
MVLQPTRADQTPRERNFTLQLHALKVSIVSDTLCSQRGSLLVALELCWISCLRSAECFDLRIDRDVAELNRTKSKRCFRSAVVPHSSAKLEAVLARRVLFEERRGAHGSSSYKSNAITKGIRHGLESLTR